MAPAIGAILLARTGPDLLFAIDAATFAISAALVATLPSGRRRLDSTRSLARPRRRARVAGSACSRSASPRSAVVAAANFASGLAVTVTQALLVVAAHEHYGGDAAVGYLYAGVGVGGTLGGIIALRVDPAAPLGERLPSSW